MSQTNWLIKLAYQKHKQINQPISGFSIVGERWDLSDKLMFWKLDIASTRRATTDNWISETLLDIKGSMRIY